MGSRPKLHPQSLVETGVFILSTRPRSAKAIHVWHNDMRMSGDEERMIAASPPPQRPSLTPISDDHPPEPNAVLMEAADEAEMPLPYPQTFFLGGLFALGVLAAVYVASSIILPIVLAFVLSLLLHPLCISWSARIYPAPLERS